MSIPSFSLCRRWIAGACLLCVLIVGEGCLRRKSGEELVHERCTECHMLFAIEAAHKTRQEWVRTVSRMIQHGARLDNQEIESVVGYLTRTYGPK